MSETGSFVTDHINCDKCLEAAKEVLLGRDKHLCSVVIHGWGNKSYLPIIAGKIGGLYRGEELHTFEDEFIPELRKTICHPIRIAVLAQDGEQIYKVVPEAEQHTSSGD